MLLEHAPVDDLQSNALRLFMGDGPWRTIGRPFRADQVDGNGGSERAASILLLPGTDARTAVDRLPAMLSDCARELPPGGRVAVLCRSPASEGRPTLRALLRRAVGRDSAPQTQGVAPDVVRHAVAGAGFQDVRIWTVEPSAEVPQQVWPSAAPEASTFLVTAAMPGTDRGIALERALRRLAAENGDARLTAIQRLVNSARGKSVAVVGEGADRWVVRIARSAAMLEDEARSYRVLQELQRSSAAPLLPRPVGISQEPGFTCFAQSHLRGAALSSVLKEGNRAQYVGVVAAFLRSLNADVPGSAVVPYDDAAAWELFRPMVDFALSHLSDDALRSSAARAVAEALAGASGRMGVVHGDFGPGNLLVEGATLTGVIDWEAVRSRGPLVLDAINYLDSAHRCCQPQASIADTLPLLVNGQWPVAEEAAFLRETFTAAAVDPRYIRGAALLYALFHFRPQLRFANADAGPVRRLETTLRRLIGLR